MFGGIELIGLIVRMFFKPEMGVWGAFGALLS